MDLLLSWDGDWGFKPQHAQGGMDFSAYHVGSGVGIQVVSHYRGHHGASELSQSLSQSLMTFLTVLESKLECWELP